MTASDPRHDRSPWQPGLHNYQVKFTQMLSDGELVFAPGAANEIDVFHDDWCAIYTGGLCNCDPEIWPRRSSKPVL